ncbi:MAG: hypothetical protein HY260_16325 [Chloroflexi bacterium]|nr:hypothetical protein [Chloroflexota bacterium]
MRLSKLINLGLIAVGAAASVKTLRRRAEWERENTRAYLVLDYDDALAVCTRAGIELDAFLTKLKDHGATHLALPELTLNRLMREGRIAISPPPSGEGPGVRAQWVYLAATEPELIAHLATELVARVPSSCAHVATPQSLIPDLPPTLALQGHLPTLAEMGLGFEASVAAEVTLAGLGVVPRPVSFSWPADHLIERTLAQAAGLGAKIVAFDGDLILGHEMHLDKTVECLERFDLTFAYFCETRHQKGDWFIAKRLAARGRVVLSHYFTPQAMVPEDFHSAAHHWGMLARARGIRLCYVNVFRRIHATEPLECLHYVEHIKEAMEEIGRNPKSQNPKTQSILAAPDRDTLALAGLVTAGAATMAVAETLSLSEPVTLGLTVVSAAGAAALPYLERSRGHLEESYPPSYAPKLLALAGAASAPIAAATFSDDPMTTLAGGAVIQAGAATSLAAFTTGQDYQQRIEEYRSLNADLFLPVAAALWRDIEHPATRALALAALGAGWYAANKFAPDILGGLDRDLPAGHTHHLSAAQRIIGDAQIAFGPRPGRKWAGIGLAGVAAAVAFRAAWRNDAALAASLVGAVGNALMLAAFRRPERPLKETLPAVGRSWMIGAVVGTVAALLLGGGKNGRET